MESSTCESNAVGFTFILHQLRLVSSWQMVVMQCLPEVCDLVLQEHSQSLLDLLEPLLFLHGDRADAVRPATGQHG